MRPLTLAQILLLPVLASCAAPASMPMPLAEPPEDAAPVAHHSTAPLIVPEGEGPIIPRALAAAAARERATGDAEMTEAIDLFVCQSAAQRNGTSEAACKAK